MILEKVDSPRDLKPLTIADLKALSAEIRRLIIDVVSRKGGHLASSLGAVETVVALHYCLEAPVDDIVFDVGHQSYAHKILTARKDRFPFIREAGGISGFPDCRESPYDVYTCGHASTAVSWAQGLAEAKRLKKESSRTVALIGDGSLTGGMTFEALNNCGHAQSNVLVILNHNEMSISRSVGALSNYLTKIISAPLYNRFRSNLEGFIKNRMPKGRAIMKLADRFEKELKAMFIPGAFFEELGFRYFGPIDGNDLELLIPTLKNILDLPGPRLLHIVTKKGKGHDLSEKDPAEYHSASPFDQAAFGPAGSKQPGFGEIMAAKLVELAKGDERIVAITAAMPAGTGLDIFGKAFPHRFFDVGIAEEHAVGFASGLAKKGFKPIVAVYSTFLQRSIDQIIHDVALQKVPVVFAVDRAGLVGEDGPTHHGAFDVGYFRQIPNMTCLAPKDSGELEAMLEFAFKQDGPVSIRYPRGAAFSLSRCRPIELGKGEILSDGRDACLIALGTLVKEAMDAAAALALEGISVCVVNPRFIKPLDEGLIKYLLGRHRLIVTVEDAALLCGFGSAVLESISRLDRQVRGKTVCLGLPDEFVTFAGRGRLLSQYGLDAAGIVAAIKKELKLTDPRR